MDVVAVSQAVALMAATGAVSGLSEIAALDAVNRIRDRIRSVFGDDGHSVRALDDAIAEPTDQLRLQELVSALVYYAEQYESFLAELSRWAGEHVGGSVQQNVNAGRDAYTAGRDMTINQRPEKQPPR